MIRLLTVDDAAAWREFRLYMLLDEPSAFCSAHADVVARPARFFADWLVSHRVFVVEEQGQLVGSAVWQKNGGTITGHRGEVSAVFLRPEARGRELIDRLLEAVVTDARGKVAQLELDVNAGNPAAICAYARNGFAEVARLPRHMKHGDLYSDAIRMVRAIDG